MRWGVLGCAKIAREQFLPALQDAKENTLWAIASRDKDKAQALSQKFGGSKAYGSYLELLEDQSVDAVYIPLPNHLHKEWSIQALQAGKHVLCEKPMALNVAECEEVLEAAKSNNRQFMEGFMYLFHPQMAKAKQLVKDGAIGDVKLIKGSFSFMLEDKENVRIQPGYGGGSLMDVGCYPIHFSNFLYDELPLAVSAHAKLESKADVDWSLVAVLEYTQGKLASFDSSFEMANRQFVEIVGTRGTIEIPKPWRPDRAEVTISVKEGAICQEIAFPVSNSYQLEIEGFAASVKQGTSPKVSTAMSRNTIAVINGCQQSVREGRKVSLQA